MSTDTPIFEDLLLEDSGVVAAALARPRWSYAAALKAADEAIAVATARAKRIHAAQKKTAPAKKAAARKGASS